MGFPGAVAGVGMGAQAAGSIVGAIGSIWQGQAQSQMYNYQAGIAKVNQQIEQQNANYALQVGEVAAQQSGLQTKAVVSGTKAAQGASNIDVNSGSTTAVRSSETELGQENEAIIRADAAKRAYGYSVGAFQQGAQAEIYKTSAATSITAGDIGAASSLLGGVSGVSSKWLQASQSGAFSG